MTQAFVGLGSNIGERNATIEAALEAIGMLDETRVIRVSTLIETKPIGPIAQGDYLNGVCQIETGLAARGLLDALLDIERSLGRDRAGEMRWGPRTVDLDLLLFGDRAINEQGLCVPHPRLSGRLFVLEPLCEIAPERIVPGCRQTVHRLYKELIRRGG